jgi:D-3-phosphoglycerate dehydrogenase / 2-oxoglutarate reductase
MKILANDGISNEGKIALENAGFTVITDKVDQVNLADFVNQEDVEIVLVRSATTVRKEVIDACPNLKLIGRGGVGMDNIDVAYARENGRIVINTPASSSQSVAELVMGHLFAISRSLHHSFKHLETSDFSTLKKQYGKGIELRGKTLLIVGFGRIGQSLASYALGCGMNILAINAHETTVQIPLGPFPGIGKINIPILSTTDLMSALPQADFISLHVPKQVDGSAVIGEKEFAVMKKGAGLVNAARGGVVDEKALLSALESGKIAFAGLDVFENEPNPFHELLKHDKIAVTPHIGAATNEAQDRIGLELADLIIAQFGKQVLA